MGLAVLAAGFSSFFAAASSALASMRLRRASRAALSFAAVASLESWNVAFVGALVDLTGGGGVGKETETGRRLEAR